MTSPGASLTAGTTFASRCEPQRIEQPMARRGEADEPRGDGRDDEGDDEVAHGGSNVRWSARSKQSSCRAFYRSTAELASALMPGERLPRASVAARSWADRPARSAERLKSEQLPPLRWLLVALLRLDGR